MAMKRNGKSPVSSDSDEKVMFFKDVSLGPHESQLRFRLIHFWKARVKKTLIGLDHASATLAGDFGIGSEQLLLIVIKIPRSSLCLPQVKERAFCFCLLMGEELADTMNLDLNFGPGPESDLQPSLNETVNLVDWSNDPSERSSEAVTRIRTRHRTRFRQLNLPIPVISETHMSIELNQLM
ncbi:hypothetical protein YC2023_007336 [Brassica napus]